MAALSCNGVMLVPEPWLLDMVITVLDSCGGRDLGSALLS